MTPEQILTDEQNLRHWLVGGAAMVGGLLALGSLVMAITAAWQARRRGPDDKGGMKFTGYWGGFGGAGSGWHVTPPVVTLVGAALLAAAAVGLLASVLQSTLPHVEAKSDTKVEAKVEVPKPAAAPASAASH